MVGFDLLYLRFCIASQEGDLILTGTPSGIGPLGDGDQVECSLSTPDGKELANLTFNAVNRIGGYHYQPS